MPARRGKRDACSKHVDAHILDDVAPYARYRGEGIRLCWGCFAALYPNLAKLKVRKEHYVLAELQRLVCLGHSVSELLPISPSSVARVLGR